MGKGDNSKTCSIFKNWSPRVINSVNSFLTLHFQRTITLIGEKFKGGLEESGKRRHLKECIPVTKPAWDLERTLEILSSEIHKHDSGCHCLNVHLKVMSTFWPGCLRRLSGRYWRAAIWREGVGTLCGELCFADFWSITSRNRADQSWGRFRWQLLQAWGPIHYPILFETVAWAGLQYVALCH